MGVEWRPTAGQVALVEPVDPEPGCECLTGIVLGDAHRVLVDLGASPRPGDPKFGAVASFFAPEALYRLHGTAVLLGDGTLALDDYDVERVQRRSGRRLRTTLPVSLASFDGPGEFVSVAGETIDIAPGGCRVVTRAPFPRGADPTVSIELPDGGSVVALARVLEARVEPGHCEYRMVFASIEDDDRRRLTRLTTAA